MERYGVWAIVTSPRLICISYVYFTQVMQAETLASAYRLWRRNWRGRGRESTAGALVWQVRKSAHSSSDKFDDAYLDKRLLACDILVHC
jgi:hypothetical protein